MHAVCNISVPALLCGCAFNNRAQRLSFQLVGMLLQYTLCGEKTPPYFGDQLQDYIRVKPIKEYNTIQEQQV